LDILSATMNERKEKDCEDRRERGERGENKRGKRKREERKNERSILAARAGWALKVIPIAGWS
jgi:hypothetical protein